MAQINRDTKVRIDIVSDVVCPWCVIGYKQLERALERTGVAADIDWHPFELNPQMVEEGEDLREHLAAKYGTTRDESIRARARLTALGSELGFPFNYSDDMRMYNTFRAHQLLHWAGMIGRRHNLKLALFGAFFTKRRNVSDPIVLADTAMDVGLDREEALAILGDGRNAEATRQEEAFWISRGIRGVPAVLFDRKSLVVGAQGVDRYVEILQSLTEGRAA